MRPPWRRSSVAAERPVAIPSATEGQPINEREREANGKKADLPEVVDLTQDDDLSILVTSVPDTRPTTPAIDLTPSHQAREASRTSRRAMKREQWESLKDEVHKLYVLEGMTLQATISKIEKDYTFKAR